MTKYQPLKIEKAKILAVEGMDEINFFLSLFRIMELEEEVQLLDFEGKSNFENKIPSLAKVSNFDTIVKLGFVRDAENTLANLAFQSVSSNLNKAGLSRPSRMNFFSDSNPSIGIFIMPNNSDTGMLEDLCLQSIDESEEKNCIENFIDCFPLRPANFHTSKAKVQTYLASKTPIVNSLGLGALNGHWDFTKRCFDDIKNFLENFRY